MIAIIAGTGRLPALLAEVLESRGQAPLICVFHDFEPDVSTELPRLSFRLETFGSLLQDLRARGVRELCMAGAVRRHAIDTDLIDSATAPLMPRIARAISKGDDGALREIITIIEEHGISVLAATDIRPDLLIAPGVPTRVRPDTSYDDDAVAGEAAIAAMARRDEGQSVVVRGGQVFACEGPEGTAALIARCGAEAGNKNSNNRGMVLYKAPKPGQERRADLPAIGPDTARDCAAAGFAGIVVEAGGVMVLDSDEVIDRLDRAGCFLWVRPRSDLA